MNYPTAFHTGSNVVCWRCAIAWPCRKLAPPIGTFGTTECCVVCQRWVVVGRRGIWGYWFWVGHWAMGSARGRFLNAPCRPTLVLHTAASSINSRPVSLLALPICSVTDDRLFAIISKDERHSLYSLLPPLRSQHYDALRKRSHDFQLAVKRPINVSYCALGFRTSANQLSCVVVIDLHCRLYCCAITRFGSNLIDGPLYQLGWL